MAGRRALAAVAVAVAGAVALAAPAPAEERAGSLADIRAQIGALSEELTRLRAELAPTGSAAALAGGSVLDRLGAVEGELARLTARTEELEFRIGRIVADGTARLADLEFRLVELEGGDVAAVGRGAPLGGAEAAPAPAPGPGPAAAAPEGPLLAVGEEAAFAAAEAAFLEADWQGAVAAFGAFVETYPGGPLAARAQALRAEALVEMGETARAARGWLAAFEADPEGPQAPAALLGLGRALGALGQVEEACIMLDEIGFRFPASPEAGAVGAARREVGCP